MSGPSVESAPARAERGARHRAALAAEGFTLLSAALGAAERDVLIDRLERYERRPDACGETLEVQYESARGNARRARRIRHLARAEPHVWEVLWRNDAMQGLLAALYRTEIRVVESSAFLKPAEVGSRTPMHQDQALWRRARRAAVVCWTALDATSEANGCLVVCPRSHRRGLLSHDAASPRHAPELVADVAAELPRTPVPMRAGDVLVWDPYLVHGSGVNRSREPRRGVMLVLAPAEGAHPEEGPVALVSP